MKLKLNDTVQIIAGKDKGKKGKIIKIDRKNNKIVVEKVNIRTKHVKKSNEKRGEKIKYEGAISASNAMIVCQHCDKRVRVAYKSLKTGRKERICKKCKETLDKEVRSKK